MPPRTPKGVDSAKSRASNLRPVAASSVRKGGSSNAIAKDVRAPVIRRSGGLASTSSIAVHAKVDDMPVVVWREESKRDPRRGGRPKIENARTISVSCMVSRAERELIRQQADEYNIAISQLLRISVFDILNTEKLPKQRGLTDEARKMMADLARVGSNLNQISRGLNSRPASALTFSDIEILKEQYVDVHEMLRALKQSLKVGDVK